VVLSRAPVLRLGSDLLPARNAPSSEQVMAVNNGSVPASAGSSTLEQIEKEHILHVLEQAAWVIEGECGAAKILDLHPNTLRSRMKKLGIVRGAKDRSTSSNGREAAI